jgi:hypothetical protein
MQQILDGSLTGNINSIDNLRTHDGTAILILGIDGKKTSGSLEKLSTKRGQFICLVPNEYAHVATLLKIGNRVTVSSTTTESARFQIQSASLPATIEHIAAIHEYAVN